MRRHSGYIVFALALLAQPMAAAPARPPVKRTAPVKRTVAKPAVKPAVRPAAKPARLANIVPAALPDTPEIQALRRAFRFGFAPYEMLRTRQLQLSRVAAAGQGAGMGTGVNALIPRFTLADASMRDVTTPNNDTLYASAWLDLAQGPVFFSTPNLKRYHSAALMSITSDVLAVLGTRSSGAGGGRYAIVGPNWRGDLPAGVETVRSQSNDAWLLVRVVVNGENDLAAAADGLMRFTLSAVGGETPLELKVPAKPDGKAFLTAVGTALERSGDALLISRAAQFADQGIGKAWETLTPEQQKLWNDSLPGLIHELRAGLAAGDSIDGWVYPPFNMAAYGDDDDLRARVALGGLAALPRIEAIYVSARTDGEGRTLTGAKSWRVKIPARLPVGGFWSLTMYEQQPDGRLFFVPNALNRFAIGDRSDHIRPEPGGGIELFVQAARPSGERVVNWLPAPKGNFVLMFRAYLPGAPLLDGSLRLPPVTEGEMIP